MAAQASALNASSFVLSLRLALPHLLPLLLLTLFDNVSSTILGTRLNRLVLFPTYFLFMCVLVTSLSIHSSCFYPLTLLCIFC